MCVPCEECANFWPESSYSHHFLAILMASGFVEKKCVFRVRSAPMSGQNRNMLVNFGGFDGERSGRGPTIRNEPAAKQVTMPRDVVTFL